MKFEEDDRLDTEEEKPVVVVIKTGDLTEEEVKRIQKDESSTNIDSGKTKIKNTCV